MSGKIQTDPHAYEDGRSRRARLIALKRAACLEQAAWKRKYLAEFGPQPFIQRDGKLWRVLRLSAKPYFHLVPPEQP